MYPWLLALLVLIGVCAIGAYYVHNTRSGLDFFQNSEGFDASGNPSVLRRQAERLCELNYQSCLDKNTREVCTKTYNECNAVAQKLYTTVSTVTNAPGSTTQTRSAQGALAYAKLYNATGAGDAVEWAKSGEMLKAQYGSSNPDFKFLERLRYTLDNGEVPTKVDVEKAQSLGFFGELGEDIEDLYKNLSSYITDKIRIFPHQTPITIVRPITATLASDKGTAAEDGEDDGSQSLRSQIRRDVRNAIREELEEIDNEYEIKYE
jgi:hypothetical protein